MISIVVPVYNAEPYIENTIHMPLVASEDTATWWQILRNKFLAMKRIFHLYREQEKLGLIPSCYYFCFWAFRAPLRRI